MIYLKTEMSENCYDFLQRLFVNFTYIHVRVKTRGKNIHLKTKAEDGIFPEQMRSINTKSRLSEVAGRYGGSTRSAQGCAPK